MNKDLDRLVQQLCVGKRCAICKGQATEIHHIIGRANKFLRYDPNNLLPVCHSCHCKIHDKGLDPFEYISPERAGILKRLKNKSYRDILTFELQMSEEEFLRECRNYIKELLSQ